MLLVFPPTTMQFELFLFSISISCPMLQLHHPPPRLFPPVGLELELTVLPLPSPQLSGDSRPAAFLLPAPSTCSGPPAPAQMHARQGHAGGWGRAAYLSGVVPGCLQRASRSSGTAAVTRRAEVRAWAQVDEPRSQLVTSDRFSSNRARALSQLLSELGQSAPKSPASERFVL